jgi:hypothetical protein
MIGNPCGGGKPFVIQNPKSFEQISQHGKFGSHQAKLGGAGWVGSGLGEIKKWHFSNKNNFHVFG